MARNTIEDESRAELAHIDVHIMIRHLQACSAALLQADSPPHAGGGAPTWRDPTQVLVKAERKPVDTSGWSDFDEMHRNPHAKKSSLKDGESPKER